MTKPARTKSAKITGEPIERHLGDGSDGFKEGVQQRLRELLRKQIVALRQERGWSQAMLADRAGFKQPYIAKIESGNFENVELKTLVRIAEALDASLEINLMEKETPHPSGLVPSTLPT
jgi:ribosome-binding protein aMBF1 (putative translation factor)